MMEISVLNDKELEVHDMFVTFTNKLSKLSLKQRKKVYHRWLMLHLLEPKGIELIEKNLKRVTTPL